MKTIFSILFVASFCFSIDMQLSRSVTARKEVNGVLKRVGFLAPETVVKIIDVEIEKQFKSDQEDEARLLTWIKNKGQLHFYEDKAGIKKDYFYPVEIIQNKFSAGVKVGDVVFVSLRYLARRDGLKMVVNQDTVIVEKTSKQRYLEFQSKLEPLMAKVERKAKRNIKNRGALNSTILKNCPLSFDDFLEESKTLAEQKRIPVALLLSVLQVESSGNCFSKRKEYNGSYSIGLFQVNTATSSVPACTRGQLQVLKNSPSKFDLETIRCLENPLANLKEAVALLRAKYASVNSRKQPVSSQWWQMNEGEKNAWRKTLAAYNGGQAYVFQAYRDMRAFSRRTGVDLDSNIWEHRRIFFMRNWLDRGEQKRIFGKRQKFRRGLYDTVLNLAYVETIAGRRAGDFALADKWQRQLTKNKKVALLTQ